MRKIQFEIEGEIKSGVLSDDDNNVIVQGSNDKDVVYSLEKVQLLTPQIPGKIVCVGRNYAAHAAELGNDVPKEPLLFLKAPSSIIFDGDSIDLPGQSSQVEHEGELGIVIGKNCKNLSDEDDFNNFVLGYICLNDVTARDLQKKDVQFTRAKSFDTFCPVSKYIQRNADVTNLNLSTMVNGDVKQSGNTSQMIFPVEFLVKYISRQMTLNFGDIIATGTPSGVSILNDGDVCEVEIEGIGKISNPVKKSENQ